MAKIIFAVILFTSSAVQASSRKSMQRGLMGTVGACKELSSSWTPKWANLKGYWKLNESSGATSVTDSSSTGATGSSLLGSGVAFGSQTYLGKAVSLPGTGSIDIGNNAALTPAHPLTIAAWIKIPSINPSNQIVFSTDLYDGVTLVNYCGTALHLEGTSGEAIITYGDCGGGGATHRRTGGGTVPVSANRWHHIVGIVTGPTNMAIYIDGVADTVSYSGTGGAQGLHGSYNGTIGGRPNAWPFNGIIEEVALWNAALTATEVKTIFEAQNCGRN